MKRIPHVCITCRHYEPYRCNSNDAYISHLDCDEPNKCRAWELSDDYKKGGKFYEKEKAGD